MTKQVMRLEDAKHNDVARADANELHVAILVELEKPYPSGRGGVSGTTRILVFLITKPH